MKHKLWIAPIAVAALAVVAERSLVKPVLAQVRAAITQSVDEPGRNPFIFSHFTLSSQDTFVVPAGQRYVVERFTADCFMQTGATLNDVTLVGVTGGLGAQMELTAVPHPASLFFYRATGEGPLYADPGSTLTITAVPSNGNGPASVRSCQFYITGHAIQNP